jgi:hypothetical protein
MGDSQFWCALKRLGEARDPLITISARDVHDPALKANWYHDASFELTETGQAMLTGERDFIEINGIDLWLGGVHLVVAALWRWDEHSGRLTQRSA